jgi:hypothetical protein
VKRLAAIALLAGLAATPTERVDAALCKTRKGALVVRDGCKRKETPADPSTFGVVSSDGDPGPRGTSTPRLRAFDAIGAFIGHVSAAGFIVLQTGDRAIYLQAGTDGFHAGGSLFFEAPGCAGTALVANPGHLVPRPPVHGTTAYLVTNPVEPHAIQSSLATTDPLNCMGPMDTYDVATQLCCGSAAFSIDAGPAVPIDLSGHAPPFRVEIDR